MNGGESEKNEEDGLLVDYLNSSALAEGLCRLIEDGELRKRMGHQARVNVKRFSKESVMNQWERIFSSMLNMKD